MTDPYQDPDGDAADSMIVRRPASVVELPVLPLQEGWLTVETRFPGASTPLVQLVHRLRGTLSVDALVRAVGALVDRHESLRGLFADRGERTTQVIGPAGGLEVERVDLEHLPADERVDRARSMLRERRKARFDLANGPLVKACLLRLTGDDHVLAVTIHHVLADGLSLGILSRDLGVFYRAFLAGTEPDLPELSIQYGDYAVWYATMPQPQREEDQEYWVELVRGVPALELRTDRPRPPRKGAPAGDLDHSIGAELTGRIVELAKARRCSPNMVLLAVVQALLGRRSGQTDFCVGIPVAGIGRRRPDTSELVGLFNTMLPVRCDLSGDPAFAGLLADTRDNLLDGLDHEDIALSRLSAALGLPHDPSRTNLTQVLFQYYEADAGQSLSLPGLAVEGFPLDIPNTPFDLMVYTGLRGDGLGTLFIYDTALFDQTSIEALAVAYENVLRFVADHPEARLSELPADW
jgi:hypothetical protein